MRDRASVLWKHSMRAGFNIDNKSTIRDRSLYLSLQEFKEHLTAITDKSNDLEIMEHHEICEERGTPFLYLGSRNEIDYGTWMIGSIVDQRELCDDEVDDHPRRTAAEIWAEGPSDLRDSTYIKSLFYICETNLQKEFPDQTDRVGLRVSLNAIQVNSNT